MQKIQKGVLELNFNCVNKHTGNYPHDPGTGIYISSNINYTPGGGGH